MCCTTARYRTLGPCSGSDHHPSPGTGTEIAMKFGVLAAALAAVMGLGAPHAEAQPWGGGYDGPPRRSYGEAQPYYRSPQRPPPAYGYGPQPRSYGRPYQPQRPPPAYGYRPQPRPQGRSYQPPRYSQPYREPVAPGYRGPRYYTPNGGVWTVPNYGQGGDFGGGSNSQ